MKNSIIIILVCFLAGGLFQDFQKRKQCISIYTTDDILHVYTHSNRIETEKGKVIQFNNADALNEFIEDTTARVSEQSAIYKATEFVQMEIVNYNLSTDEEIQKLVNKSAELYNLTLQEKKAVETKFYL